MGEKVETGELYAPECHVIRRYTGTQVFTQTYRIETIDKICAVSSDLEQLLPVAEVVCRACLER